MSHKKKPHHGRSNTRSGSKQSAPRPSSSKKTTTRKTSSKKTTTEKSAPRKTTKVAPRHRGQGSAERPPLQAAPSLREAPRRKPVAQRTEPAEKVEPTQEPPSQRSPESNAPPPSDRGFDDSRFAEPYPANPMDFDMLGIGSPVFPPGGFDLDTDEDSGVFEDTDAPATPWADDPSVEMRIREIEERLDGLMASEPHEDLDHAAAPETPRVAPATADTAVDAAREVLESDYYRRKWGRTSLRLRENEVDEFGMDPSYEEKLRPALNFMFKNYFRVEVDGIRNVPSTGRAVVVANHSGALPFDGVMLREAIRQRHSGRDDLRWLAEDFSFYLPFLGVTLNRLGAVRACPENAERLLSKEHLVGVFPEGAEGIKKLYRDRYRLQRFGRGGFVRLCLKTQSPIIPCAIIGAEETNPIVYRFDNLSKLLGLDYLPITPTFPLLGPLGLLPAPTKWRIIFGEPISVDEYGPQAAQDHVLVGRLSERVRASINDLLETALRRRKSIWL